MIHVITTDIVYMKSMYKTNPSQNIVQNVIVIITPDYI